MKVILGEKQHMTQIFTDAGEALPATRIVAGPVVVTQVKGTDTDGYEAVQIGYGAKSANKVGKALKGHLKDKGPFLYIQEFRGGTEGMELGTTLDVSQFTEGDTVTVVATSKGKGFQGVVKRHGFGGGRRTHGQKHSEREPGSIGVGGVQRVFKGMRMAGRMGGDRVTVKKVKVLKVDPKTHELILAGSIPGRKGTLIALHG